VKIKGAVLQEFNKGYSIEDLELDPPKQDIRARMQRRELSGRWVCTFD